MSGSDEFCIVEIEEGSLPDHWTEEGVTDRDRRVMETFESDQKARDYLQEMYGMYRDDAIVLPIEELDVTWK